MAETKHTPGPWQPLGLAVKAGGREGDPRVGDRTVAYVETRETLAEAAAAAFGEPTTAAKAKRAEADANVRLIAAAPEMLEAIGSFLAGLVATQAALPPVLIPYVRRLREIHDAIDKAEGR